MITLEKMITQVSDSLYSKLVHEFESDPLLGKDALRVIREEAFGRFKSKGFPTVKNEDWKYTNLQALLKKDYVRPSYDEVSIDREELEQFAIPELDAYQIVLVNGQYRPELSDPIRVEGLTVHAIEESISDPVLLQHFAGYADKTDSSMVALNTALFEVGLFIHVAKNVVLDKPIHIVRIAAGSEPTFVQTRSLYVLDAFAEVDLVESYVGLESVRDNLNNQVMEIVLAENAKLQHYTIQTASEESQYITHIEVHQRKHSLYNNYNANFRGASFVRNDINVRMDDPEVESHLYGVVLINDDQFVDNHTIVDHMKPHGESYEWYKTITQGQSTAVFNGKIFVREDAQKTNAFQQNNNVLIGDHSSVYSKPQLEIFADDVKCSHGCTIGQFDDESLFYLRARGISEEKARVLLVQAFAFDVTNRFAHDAVRHHVEHLIEQNLD